MADETPKDAPGPAPASTVTPLDQAPLSEYVSRRSKGETPAAAPPAAPAELPDEISEEPSDDTPAETPEKTEDKKLPPPRPKSRFEERLGTLTRQRHDAERALEAERQRVLQLQEELQQLRPRQEQPQQQPAQPERQPDGQPPNLDQYLSAGKSYEDWLSALVDFRAAKSIAAERQRIQQEYQQREYQQQMAGFGERTESAKAKYADYDDIVINNDRVQLSPVMQDIATRSPHGPDIMYWLGTHETEANDIGRITAYYPQDAYPLVEKYLLLLSGHSTNGSTGARKAVPHVSQAPPPITPVAGGSTMQPVPLDQAPLGEFVKRRNADLQKKRQG